MRRRVSTQPTDTVGSPWSLRVAASALNRYALSQARWHYTDGLLFKAILQLWRHTSDARLWHSVKSYVDQFVNAVGEIQTYSIDEYSIDQINPGNLLFPLYQATGEERYRTALWQLREQLRRHPRTQEGGFWHKKIYPFQMWLDGIYMGMPFYAQFAAVFDEPAAFDDIAFQISVIEKHTRDERTGLLYHAWDENCQQGWANRSTGCSPHFWSRAIGWYVMAIVDVLDHFPQDHSARPGIIANLEHTIDAVAHVQDKATGLWWQVLDQGGRPGNYLESSGTCMYIYAIAKGMRNGHLSARWAATAARGFEGLLKHVLTVSDQGQIDLHGICTSAGLGGHPYRDGSYEYYISEPVATNDLHGVGAFILAAAEMEIAQLRRVES